MVPLYLACIGPASFYCHRCGKNDLKSQFGVKGLDQSLFIDPYLDLGLGFKFKTWIRVLCLGYLLSGVTLRNKVKVP